MLILFSSTNLAGSWAGVCFDRLWIRIRHFHRFSAKQYAGLSFAAEKGTHLVLFFIFGIAVWILLGNSRYRAWKVLVCGGAVGILSESLQNFYINRDPTIRDVLLNLTGVLLAILTLQLRRFLAGDPAVKNPRREGT